MRWLSVFLIFIQILEIFSAILLEEQEVIPGHEGQCYDEDKATFYDAGDIMKSNESGCSQKNCLGFYSKTEKIRIETLTCSSVKAGPGFMITQDLSKPYPFCCPQLVRKRSDRKLGFCCVRKQKD